MSDKSCPVPESFQSMFWSILYLTLVFFLTFISRFIFSPLLPTISNDLNISTGQAGSIFLISSVGFFIGAVFSGFVSSRINHKGTLTLSIFGVSIALSLCVIFTSLATIRLAMLVIGIAAGFNLPSITAIITAIVSRPDWGKALAVQQLAPPSSLILGPLLTVFVLQWFSWRYLMGGIAAFVFLIALTLLIIARVGDFPGDAPKVSLARFILSQGSFWILIVLFALGMGGQIGVYAMMPLYLVTERGMDAETANTLVGTAQISALFMTFFSGWVTDKIGEKKAIGIFLLLSGIVTALLGLFSGPWLKVMVFLQPALIACFFPPGFAALSRIVQPDYRSLATSWVTPTALVLGGGLLPTVLGYMGEIYSIGTGISIAGILIIAGFPLAFFLKLIDKMEDGC
jgi:NNP family nitrate/nitrite transporter-like MFS transporter